MPRHRLRSYVFSGHQTSEVPTVSWTSVCSQGWIHAPSCPQFGSFLWLKETLLSTEAEQAAVCVSVHWLQLKTRPNLFLLMSEQIFIIVISIIITSFFVVCLFVFAVYTPDISFIPFIWAQAAAWIPALFVNLKVQSKQCSPPGSVVQQIHTCKQWLLFLTSLGDGILKAMLI